MELRVRQAAFGEHKELCRIAKQSRHTRDFTNMIFSGPDCYAAGRIRVALVGKKLVGLTCSRTRVRDGVTVLYFVSVLQELRGAGVGLLLMQDLMQRSSTVELKVMRDNEPAVSLYKKLGFAEAGEALNGAGLLMRWTKQKPAGGSGGLSSGPGEEATSRPSPGPGGRRR